MGLSNQFVIEQELDCNFKEFTCNVSKGVLCSFGLSVTHKAHAYA